MSFSKRVFFTVCVLIFAASSGSPPRKANGGPLVPGHISACAKWVIHMDVETMQKSNVGEFIRSKWLCHDRMRKRMDEILERTGMNPSQDLNGATLYDTSFQKHRGVTLIHVAQIDADKLLGHLGGKHTDVRVSSYGEHNLYTWKVHRKREKRQFVTGALYKDKTIVISSETAKVMVPWTCSAKKCRHCPRIHRWRRNPPPARCSLSASST